MLQRTKQKEERKGTRKEGGIQMENGAQVGGQRQRKSKKGKEGRVLGKMWDRLIFERVRMGS